MAPSPSETVLIVENDPAFAAGARDRLEQAGYATRAVAAPEVALRELADRKIDVAVLGNDFPDAGGGLAFHARLQESGYVVPVILVAAEGDAATAVKALRAGVRELLTRSPQHLDYLPEAVARVLKQVRLEADLRRSELQFHQVWDRSKDGMRITDADGVVRLVNDAYCRLVGKERSEIEGRPFVSVYAAPDPAALLVTYRARFAAGRIQAHTTKEIRLVSGQKVCFELSNSYLELPDQPPLLLSILHDMTQHRRLEEQLRQAQKMEAVGQLAGGIAHDFNNLLTVINGYSDLILGRLPESDAHRELVAEVRKAGDRAAALTRQLLAFSRKQVLSPEVLDLNALVVETERMLRRLIGEDVDLATALGPEVGRIRVDPGQLEQILLNLAVNARDAMPTGGKLTIETRAVDLDASYAARHAGVSAGAYVLLAVSDTGTGMTDEVRAHMFEPFFTTKGPGKGTGLGLATVYGIVQQSAGFIEVYSEPGVGTTFKIYFPRVSGATTAAAEAHGFSSPGGAETILVAEDEDEVRRLSRLILLAKGYTVLEARDGDEAMALVRSYELPIHLLVTDVIMPRMSGRELGMRLRSIHPEMKVLYMSGYTNDAITRHGILDTGVTFLQKPFTPVTLLRKLREVLDRG